MNHLLCRAGPAATLLGALALGAAPEAATAAVVLAPTTGWSSSHSAVFSIDKTFDQSGLSTGYMSGGTDFDSYIASAPTHAANGFNTWLSAFGDNVPTVTYDLGAVHVTSGLALWNSDHLVPAMADFWGSSDGVSMVLLGDDIALLDTGLGIDTLAQQLSWAPQALRYLQIRMSCRPNDESCSLGEVALRGEVAPVSEPGTLAMLLLAGAALGWQRRGNSPRSQA